MEFKVYKADRIKNDRNYSQLCELPNKGIAVYKLCCPIVIQIKYLVTKKK